MTKEPAKSRFKVSPDEYNTFVNQIDLKWVYLESSTIKRRRMPEITQELGYKDKTGKCRYEAIEGGFRTSFNYQIFLLEAEQEEPFAEIKCTYAAEYESEMPMTKDLFTVFKELNLPLNTWPYIREFVHGTTNRMGLPGLVLRSLKR